MAATTLEVPFGRAKSDRPTPPEQEQLEQFANWSSRCHKALHFIADLLLGDSKMAEDAVQNCWIRASRNPPSFEREGPFRGWIMRLLISEALSILHQSQAEASEANVHKFRKK